ncbi:hypothetical protein DM01DRAFT_1337132 [Hesseltinella vesiculosa]|uniref:Uncharacterized protein n=1 Tax=Hesseltinella vesiculosa TaxID=101127 RepID=A0A1X2GDZ1_9FUNG|nr:hypothetical protein DM01DRAFT_1337132 [Hesseltinella vesiculosa]
MFTYGFFIGGPTVVTWFNFLNRNVNLKNRWTTAIARTAFDVVFFTPTILAIFMTGISVLEGRNGQQIREKFETSYTKGLYNAYHFWPFASLFTQSCIPLIYRPMISSFFSIGWNSYLSYLNQKSLGDSTSHSHKALSIAQ